MEQGYYVDVNGVEYNYTIGKLNYDDWINEDPVGIESSLTLGSGIFDAWMAYANAVPFGTAGFEKGFTRNKPNTP